MNTGVVLSANQESLIKVVRTLPPHEAKKVLDWVQHLADLKSGQQIQWSDSWSDEDIADITGASFQRFSEQERDGC